VAQGLLQKWLTAPVWSGADALNGESSMLIRTMNVVATVVVVAVLTPGCEPAITPGGSSAPIVLEHEQASASLVSNVQMVLTQADERLAFVRDSEFADAALKPIVSDQECDAASIDSPSVDCLEEGAEGVETLNKLRDGVVQALQERVLLSSQLESAPNTTQLVYRLDPAIQCDGDETCVAVLTEQPVRFAIESYSPSTYEVAVSLGDPSLVPFRFTASPTSLTGQVHFQDLAAAIARLKPYMSETAEVPVLTAAEGVLRLGVSNVDNSSTRFALDVLESIQVSAPVGDQDLSLTVGTGEVAVTANSAAETLGALVYLGATSVGIPGGFAAALIDGSKCSDETNPDSLEGDCEPSSDTPALTGVFDAHLGGLTVNTLLHLGDKAIHVQGLGLGATPSTLAYNGDELLRVNINPNDGRALDLTIQVDEFNDGLQWVISPRLEALIDLHFLPLTNDLESLPSWLLDDKLVVLFEGAESVTAQVVDGGIAIMDGVLSLSSTALAGDPLVVSAGMCMGMDQPGFEGQKSLLESVLIDQCTLDSSGQ